MPRQSTRRQFLHVTAATGIGFWVAGGVQAKASKSPNERLQMGAIGVSGKGGSDSNDAGRFGDMVAICDVDERFLNKAGERFPKAEKFTDFRQMLHKLGKKIDAVTVSTPDHVHAIASAMAMGMGIHCFCQKPLTHTILEARRLGEIARQKRLVTQMGNQGTAEAGLRRAAALLRAGVLGKVTEVHVWTNRPIWPQGGDRPAPAEPPSYLNWDLYLGPAPKRPYGAGYHDFAWRGWWDFGTGALGDMACHTVNMPFRGLDLRNPTSVQAKTSNHNRDSYPKWSEITFEFPANDWRPALKFVWYDGGKMVPRDMMPDELLDETVDKKRQQKVRRLPGSGCLIIGEKGKLFSPDDYGARFKVTSGVEQPDVKFRPSPEGGHFAEWIHAIKAGAPFDSDQAPMSNFPEYASPLTETILLGNLAVYAASDASKPIGEEVQGKKIEWDAKNLKATNAPEVQFIVDTGYPEGYRKEFMAKIPEVAAILKRQ